jgi:hypothetical protein
MKRRDTTSCSMWTVTFLAEGMAISAVASH